MAKGVNYKQKKSISLISILVAFASGYLVATVFDCSGISAWLGTQLFTQGLTPAKISTAVTLPKPKFEFYTLLGEDNHTAMKERNIASKGQAAVKDAPIITAQPKLKTKLSKETGVKKQVVKNTAYIVQVASFKQSQEAEKMKAELILKGFDITVIVAAKEQNSWFRVIMGPFPSRFDAEKTQLFLAKNEQINGIVMKVAV